MSNTRNDYRKTNSTLILIYPERIKFRNLIFKISLYIHIYDALQT